MFLTEVSWDETPMRLTVGSNSGVAKMVQLAVSYHVLIARPDGVYAALTLWQPSPLGVVDRTTAECLEATLRRSVQEPPLAELFPASGSVAKSCPHMLLSHLVLGHFAVGCHAYLSTSCPSLGA